MTSKMKRTYNYPALSSKLQHHLNMQRKTGQFCDVTLKLPDAEFHVHRCVFATFSPYFASLPNAGTRAIVELTTLTKAGVEPLVEMMYTSKLTLTEDNIYYVSYAAGYFHIDETAQNCQNFLRELQGKQLSREKGDGTSDNQTLVRVRGSSSSEDLGGGDVVFSPTTHGQEEVTTTQESSDTPDVIVKEEPTDPPHPVTVWNIDDNQRDSGYVDAPQNLQAHSYPQLQHSSPLMTSSPNTYLLPSQDSTLHYQSSMEWHVDGNTALSNANQTGEFAFSDNQGSQELFNCTVCPLSFTKLSTLKRHLSTHAGQQPYQCSICSTRFRRISYLKNHMIIHTGEKPFKCNVCGSKFSQRATLFRHRAVHNKERPHQCSVCSLKFNQRSSLVRHMLSHNVEKPFSCTHCQDSFTSEETLKEHIIKVHIGDFSFEVNPAEQTQSFNSQDQVPSTSHENTLTS
ncbi:PREDICTED: adult enhancer factor 1-like [Branchiostoma belcheri]|uniref:Adult enhancer factor 1-like n=1 Tax=Branchiostoma belcheri TaxID=7741 RepID=A0A6P5ABH7_BRABE|nr:PREDICTED: adult enhancer factor 1-like [Branchiostoma belcheri]